MMDNNSDKDLIAKEDLSRKYTYEGNEIGKSRIVSDIPEEEYMFINDKQDIIHLGIYMAINIGDIIQIRIGNSGEQPQECTAKYIGDGDFRIIEPFEGTNDN